MKESRAPLIIAIVLLVLPMLYVGSYYALVDAVSIDRMMEGRSMYYRAGGPWIDSFFWPMQQIDRKVRPGVWEAGPGGPPHSQSPVPLT